MNEEDPETAHDADAKVLQQNPYFKEFYERLLMKVNELKLTLLDADSITRILNPSKKLFIHQYLILKFLTEHVELSMNPSMVSLNLASLYRVSRGQSTCGSGVKDGNAAGACAPCVNVTADPSCPCGPTSRTCTDSLQDFPKRLACMIQEKFDTFIQSYFDLTLALLHISEKNTSNIPFQVFQALSTLHEEIHQVNTCLKDSSVILQLLSHDLLKHVDALYTLLETIHHEFPSESLDDRIQYMKTLFTTLTLKLQSILTQILSETYTTDSFQFLQSQIDTLNTSIINLTHEASQLENDYFYVHALGPEYIELANEYIDLQESIESKINYLNSLTSISD